MKQKFVERTVVGGVVQIDGQFFKPKKPKVRVRDGSRHRFVVYYDENGVKSPVYAYVGNARFQRWNEDKSERCNLGAIES